MRKRFYGLGIDALAAVQHALQRRKDAHLAYRLLVDIGVVPTAEQRHLIATQAAGALPEGYSPALMALARAMYEKAQLFKMPLPAALVNGDAQK